MKRFILSLMVLAVLVSLALPASALEQEADWEYIDEQKNIVIAVSWDVEQPWVVFIAPDGTEYDPMTPMEGTTTTLGNLSLYYTIESAPAGQWKIRYDKLSNTALEVSLYNYTTGLSVEYLTLGALSGDYLPVEFMVSGPENEYYNYKISAVVDHIGEEKELRTGSARTGRDVSVSVNLDSLSTYDSYMLKLYVWYQHDGADIFDFVYSDPFAYTNPDADSQAKDFQLTVVPDEGLLYIKVPELNWRVESVLVAVFENGGSEPAMYDEYAPESVQDLQLAYDPAATEVAVEVTVNYDGTYAKPVRKTFYPRSAITIPDGEAFNTLVLPISYSDMQQQLVDVQVNDDHNEVVFNGSGSVNVTLTDDWNALCIHYTDAQGINWKLERDIFVDRVPPVLNMSQKYDGMTAAEDKLTVSGNVMDYQSVTINGQTVSVDSNGLFSQELALSVGANELQVVAVDQLGNETRYTAMVYFGVDKEKLVENQQNQSIPGGLLEVFTQPGSYRVMLISGSVCLLVILYALIFWRKERKK